MNAVSLLEKHFGANGDALAIVLRHSRMVADKAINIAASLGIPGIDLDFVEEAAILHDIGVTRVHAPDIHCFGAAPYICHGILGREILEAEGLPRHAMVCERHIGVGLTTDDIAVQALPLPPRNMCPITVEERIICFADLFFSKAPGRPDVEKSPDAVRKSLSRFGIGKTDIFDRWLVEFGFGTSAITSPGC